MDIYRIQRLIAENKLDPEVISENRKDCILEGSAGKQNKDCLYGPALLKQLYAYVNTDVIPVFVYFKSGLNSTNSYATAYFTHDIHKALECSNYPVIYATTNKASDIFGFTISDIEIYIQNNDIKEPKITINTKGIATMVTKDTAKEVRSTSSTPSLIENNPLGIIRHSGYFASKEALARSPLFYVRSYPEMALVENIMEVFTLDDDVANFYMLWPGEHVSNYHVIDREVLKDYLVENPSVLKGLL